VGFVGIDLSNGRGAGMQGRLESIESCRRSEARRIPVAGRWVARNPPRREIHRAKLISLFCCFAFFNLGPGTTVDRDLDDKKAFSSNDVRLTHFNMPQALLPECRTYSDL
jgi:hypothetical protein